jgi:anti-sigma factor RsiW
VKGGRRVMKCETIRNMISSYIDKDLNDIEKTALEKHLAECEQCREEYETMLDIIAVCGNLEEVELPQNFRTELHQKLEGEKKKRNLFSNFLGKAGTKMATGLVAAALVIAIGIGGSSLLLDNNAKTAQDSGAAPGYGTMEAPAAVPAAPAPDMNNGAKFKESESQQRSMATAEQPQITSIEGSVAAKNSVGIQFNESLMADQAAPYKGVDSSRSGRMVIRTGNLSLNVESVDKAAADIRQLAESSGGYVENSQIEIYTEPPVVYADGSTAAKETTQKYGNITVRVPEEQFESIFNNIKGMGKLVSENISGNDITSQYRDTAARVDNLKMQEQSLRQLMTKAKNVDEILRIETELNRVRTDIDIYSGDLKRWDELVQLSSINIYLKELKPEELKNVDVPGMLGKAYQGFIKAVNNIIQGIEKAFIMLITAIPYLLILGALTAAGLVIARKIKLKKKK